MRKQQQNKKSKIVNLPKQQKQSNPISLKAYGFILYS